MSRPTTTLLSLTLAITLALTLALPAFARKFEGVTLPDSIELGGQSLVLNGMGLREKVFIDVYVAGLYLPQKTTDARKAIDEDVPKRIDMVMKRDVSRDQLADTMRESLGKAGSAEAKAKADTLAGWMEDVSEGDHVVLDYVPGAGPKYRDPASGSTWTGRGRRPAWVVALEASGKSLDSCRI